MKSEADYSWLTPEFYTEAYRRFANLRWSKNGPELGIDIIDLDKASLELPESTSNFLLGSAMPLIDGTYSRLLGDINGLLDDLYWISTWEKVLEEYEDFDQRGHLIGEFIEHRAIAVLGAPYSLKYNLIFSAVKIGIILARGAKGKIPKDREINIKHLENWIGDWDQYDKLLNLMRKVDDKSYRELTKNFRNRFVHNTPMHIEVGIIPDYQIRTIYRNVNGQDIPYMAYSPNHTPPLTLSDIMQACVPQFRALKALLFHFRTMLINQLRRS